MSANFYCWEPSLGLRAEAEDFPDQVDQLYEQADKQLPTALMLLLVERLLSRYPDLDDEDADTVWAAGPLKSEIIGQFINMAVSWSRCDDEVIDFIRSTAHGLGLHFYDPQDELFYPAPHAS